jgi:hypothetical protein
MRKTVTLFMAGIVFAGNCIFAQSLADAARKEAERRKALEEQGVPSRTIVQQGPPQSTPAVKPPSGIRGAASEGRRAPASHYRATLEKLQREITRTQERLESVRQRLEIEKNMPFRLGRSSQTGSSLNQQKLHVQLQELDSRLARLQEERRKAYDEGRRAGYLPGELDGKGITP